VSVTLYHGDCLVEMAKVPDGSVDLILADLPYGTTACSWDSVIPLEPLWAHYKRIIKPRGAIVLTASQPFTTTLIASNMAWFKYCWVWEKTMPTDHINAKNKPLKMHEDVCVFSSGTTANKSPNRMPYYPQGLEYAPYVHKRNCTFEGKRLDSIVGSRPSRTTERVVEFKNYPKSVIEFGNSNHARYHPTEKPIGLIEYLIRTYTNEGETVMDNTMGSGTTGVACVNTSRHFIGIERDDNYFTIAQNRINNARNAVQLTLFA
jgi:site-specific DNA-methyltransferase (adenine-specific)